MQARFEGSLKITFKQNNMCASLKYKMRWPNTCSFPSLASVTEWTALVLATTLQHWWGGLGWWLLYEGDYDDGFDGDDDDEDDVKVSVTERSSLVVGLPGDPLPLSSLDINNSQDH